MKLLTILTVMILALSCKEESPCSGSVHAKLRNYTGLDGCGWILQLDDESKLEPHNLEDFEIELEEGKDVHISYEEIPDAASICMVGKIVHIDCMSED